MRPDLAPSGFSAADLLLGDWRVDDITRMLRFLGMVGLILLPRLADCAHWYDKLASNKTLGVAAYQPFHDDA